MNTLTIILIICVSVLAAATVILALRKPKTDPEAERRRIAEEAERKALEGRRAEMEKEREERFRQLIDDRARESRRETESQIERINRINEENSRLREEQYEKRIEEMRRNFEQERAAMREEQQRREAQLREQTANEFKALSQTVLESNARNLKEGNNEQIELLLRPLREQLDGFRKLVSDSYTSENATRKSLADQIDRLMQLNTTIGEEARNLTTALKGNSKVQGDWGETVLETLLESAGLQRDIHFEVQATRDSDGVTLRDEEGRGQRPDVILNLPDRRRMIIDSKVSLTAFADYWAADDEAERKKLGDRHLLSVKRHIDELGAKQYQKYVRDAAGHVLMFIPNENAYLLALRLDPELWKYAFDRQVAIVSPTHLFSVMQIIVQLWQQEKQNRNTLEIAKVGGRLYDKLVRFCDEFAKVEKALNQAVSASEAARKVLATGNGNIVRSAEQLRELGAKASKTLPAEIVDSASE